MKIIAFNRFAPEHIAPTLPLVRALTQSGAQVIYHAGPSARDAITAAGAQFRNYGYDEFSPADFNPKADTTLALLPATVGLWPTLSAEIEAEKPDLIVYDAMAPWGRCLAAAYAIPSVCIVPTFAMTRFERLDMLRDNGLSLDAANRTALRRLHELTGLRLDITDALGCYGRHNIVLTSPALNAPPLDYSAGHFHFVGPTGVAEAHAEPTPLSPASSIADRPTSSSARRTTTSSKRRLPPLLATTGTA